MVVRSRDHRHCDRGPAARALVDGRGPRTLSPRVHRESRCGPRRRALVRVLCGLPTPRAPRPHHGSNRRRATGGWCTGRVGPVDSRGPSNCGDRNSLVRRCPCGPRHRRGMVGSGPIRDSGVCRRGGRPGAGTRRDGRMSRWRAASCLSASRHRNSDLNTRPPVSASRRPVGLLRPPIPRHPRSGALASGTSSTAASNACAGTGDPRLERKVNLRRKIRPPPLPPRLSLFAP